MKKLDNDITSFLNAPEVDHQVKNCLKNVLEGRIGKYQYHHNNRQYCLRKDYYCPIKKDNSCGYLNYCEGMK